MRLIARAVAVLACIALLFSIAPPAGAQSTGATIAGLVINQKNALPVSGGTVVVTQGGTTIATGHTDATGHYLIANVPPGIYSITVSAPGYGSSQSSDVAVSGGTTTTINASLIAADRASSSPLQVIGRTSRSSSQLLAATTISQTINVEDLTRTGQLRFGDSLATLPAVNFGTSSSVGDDATINLRGFGATESAALLDGHPVGPLGVGGIAYNWALSPTFGLSRVDVTYGSGAQGLYGNDTIGGAVNMVTISPSVKPEFTFQQQFGGFGISSTGIRATGTVNKLGYALAAARFGEYGDFHPGQLAQTARPDNVVAATADANGNPVPGTGSVNPPGICTFYGNDVSKCNLSANTYAVSQNTQQSIAFGKLEYALSPNVRLQGAVYDGVEWGDSTGNGDNDYTPYSVRLNQLLKNGGDAACGGNLYQVVTDPYNGTTACWTAQQYAAATYGPNGGGAGRDRSTRMGDYHLRLTAQSGIHNITVDGYANNYVYWKNSSQAGGYDINGNLIGTQTYANFYNTKGFVVSDEIANARNDLAFGWSAWHQLQTGNENDISGYTPFPTLFFGESSFFVRDSYQFSDKFSTFINGWFKRSSVTNRSTFDPRATLQYRPTGRDVLQFTYGRSDGAPNPSLKNAGTPIIAVPGGSFTVTPNTCANTISAGSGGNPNLSSEAANDFEIGYGHRFHDDSNVQLNGYVTHVTDQLFKAVEPLTQYGVGNVVFAPGALQGYVTKLNAGCGTNLDTTSVLTYLGITNTFNASSALARGFELSGRARLNRIAFVDFSYDVESAAHVGIPQSILLANPTVTNGGQLSGIPLHQGSVSLGLTPGPWDFRVDNYYLEFNNQLARPSYWYTNAYLSRAFQRGRYRLTLGGTNVFNNAVQYFGYIGLGTTPLSNGVSTKPVGPLEEYGLNPAQLTLTLQIRN